jgi:hypothetical protein
MNKDGRKIRITVRKTGVPLELPGTLFQEAVLILPVTLLSHSKFTAYESVISGSQMK